MIALMLALHGAGACASREDASRPASAASPKSVAAAPPEDRKGEVPERLAPEEVAAVLKTVAPSIKPKCWQPALDARTKEIPMPVRLLARLQVDPTGGVGSVEVEDTPTELSGLSPCIASVLRGLRFPTAKKSTTVNIPFVFEAR